MPRPLTLSIPRPRLSLTPFAFPNAFAFLNVFVSPNTFGPPLCATSFIMVTVHRQPAAALLRTQRNLDAKFGLN